MCQAKQAKSNSGKNQSNQIKSTNEPMKSIVTSTNKRLGKCVSLCVVQ